MIVCINCGAHNADQAEFCVACGGFLEWDGERVGNAATRSDAPAQPLPPPPPAPAPAPAKPGLLKRIKAAVGLESKPPA